MLGSNIIIILIRHAHGLIFRCCQRRHCLAAHRSLFDHFRPKSLSASQLRPKSRSVHRDCEASERNGGSLRDRRASEWGPREAAGRTSKRSAREEAVRGGSSEQEGSERECVTVFFLSILGVGGKGRRQRVEPNMGRAGLRLELRPALLKVFVVRPTRQPTS